MFDGRTAKCIFSGFELIDSIEELKNYLCQFITWLKKEDGSDYKVESIYSYLKEHSVLQLIKLWNHYKFSCTLHTLDGKMNILQSKELSDPKKSDSLSLEEIEQILNYLYMNINSNKSLCHHVFFWLCLPCGLRGGDAYQINRQDLHYTPVRNIFFYLSKLSNSSSSQNPLFHNTCKNKKGFWYKSSQMGYTKLRKIMNNIVLNIDINLDNDQLITNYFCHCTAIQLLKNNRVSESELQAFSGHCLQENLDEYKFNNAYIGSLNEELDDYNPPESSNMFIQKVSDVIQEIQASELSNMLIQKSSNIIQEI
ncbi:5244_t:CDS:2 [Cetraspora pellucida]|uniref:5244_t:CDS:1 n=1 Tax=Cetraspora pellucida TaxID=1433469 RepID=A0A9N9FQA7_9GLOM|nr:5244_t:CDS:2 [Cetraspora pellucida]